MKVLHLEMGRHLYGGARQVAYLLDGLSQLPGKHFLVCAEGAEIATALTNEATQVLPLPFSGDLDLRFVGRLRRLIRAWEPDLLHIHSRRGDWLAALAGRLEGVPMIHSRRVDNPPGKFDTHLKFPFFSRIITISEGIREVLLRAGVESSRLVCIPSAVDTGIFRPGGNRSRLLQEWELNGRGPIIGVIAQLIPRKGHRVLFEAMPAVLSRHPDATVLVLGKGPEESALRGIVQDRGWERQVRFAGFRTDLDQIIPCLDMVVHPAFMEGLGVSLLETAACGVPIVACRAGGIPEIVHHGKNGLLVEPGDHVALGLAILELLDDREQCRRFGLGGAELARERFSIVRMVEGNHRLYQQVLETAHLNECLSD